jgi:hypothetical protein
VSASLPLPLFDHLTQLEDSEESRVRRQEEHAVKTCSMCGLGKPLTEFRLGEKYAGGRRTECRACETARGVAWQRTPKGRASQKRQNDAQYAKNAEAIRRYSLNRQRTKPWCRLLGSAKNRAKKAGLPYDLTFEWAASRWTDHCEITGIKFRRLTGRLGPNAFSPSIDRIDNSLGYTQSNCRFILAGVNSLKNDGTDDEMISIAKAIVRWSKERPVAAIVTGTDLENSDNLPEPACRLAS